MYQNYLNLKALLETHQGFTTGMKTAAYIRNPLPKTTLNIWYTMKHSTTSRPENCAIQITDE